MIFVFMVILILIISVGISFLGLGALSPESMKELSLNMENLSGVNLINYTGYQFYSPL
jgi:p-aminobenzoyl-glutamate transporter AbgT